MIATQYIKLNMTPSGALPILYCSQYDIGRPLGMAVYNGGEVVDLGYYSVTIEATRTDGTAITAAVTTDGNIGAFETTATMTNKADRYGAQLVLSAFGKRVASLPFVMVVVKAEMDENAESIEEDASLYQQYTRTVQTLIADIRAQLNAEASTRAAQDASLQSQIDQIIAPSGEAPSAAEVENARIGADGITYNTLGNAIRGQVGDIRNAFGKYAAWSVMDIIPFKSETINGITFTYDGNGLVHYSGTNTSDATFYLLQRQSRQHYMPIDVPYIIDFDTANEKVFVQFLGQDSGGTATTLYTGNSADDAQVTLASNLVTISLRLVIKPGTHNGSVKIGLQSLREKDYVDGLVVEDAVDAVVAMSPIFDQAVRIHKGSTVAGGIEYKANDGKITYVGTRTGNSIFQMLNASDISPFKKGHTFYVSFDGNDVMYLQLLIDGVEFLSGKLYDSEPVVIPTSFTTFNFRVLINASGTYDDVATLSIREETDVYQDLKISTSTELYNFLLSPIPFTRLILEPKTYDLYTSRYQNDITNDTFVAKYLSNVKIVGNGATISLMVPQSVCLEHLATCNKIAGLSVGGNVEVSDLTIMTQNIRYALHDESLGMEANFYTVHKYTNVYFYHSITSPETIGVVGNTIGIGGSLGQRYLFERCTFENTTSRGTFYIHGRNYNIGELSFDGCYFVPKQSGHDLVPYQYTGNGLDMPINIVNSYVGTCYTRIADGGVSDCQWKVTAINSYLPNLIYGSDLTDIPTPKRINTINGTIDTTYTTY